MSHFLARIRGQKTGSKPEPPPTPTSGHLNVQANAWRHDCQRTALCIRCPKLEPTLHRKLSLKHVPTSQAGLRPALPPAAWAQTEPLGPHAKPLTPGTSACTMRFCFLQDCECIATQPYLPHSDRLHQRPSAAAFAQCLQHCRSYSSKRRLDKPEQLERR